MDCYLGSKNQIQALIQKTTGFIYIDKGYHKSVSEEIYSEIKKRDGLIVSLDEEGAVDYPDGSTLMSRYSRPLFENADLVFLWGEQQFNLVRKNIVDPTKVEITGHPRFEMLKKEFHFLYQEQVKKIKEKYGDFVLFNTNMGFGNNIRGTEFVEINYGARFKNIKENISFDKEKLDAYSKLIEELSQKVSSDIIIRPHPEEDRNFYVSIFKNNKKVHIVYDGSVIPWLLAADFLIHPDCTTGIESLFLGKKSISYLPHGYPNHLATHLPLKASHEFTNRDDVISFVNSGMGDDSENSLSNYPFTQDFFSVNSPSALNIAERISQLKPRNKVVHKIRALSFFDRFQLYLKLNRSKISINRKAAQLSKKKMSGFSPSEVCQISSSISANLTRECGLECINDQLFHFYP